MSVLLNAVLLAAGALASEGTLSENKRISSEHLGYDLQYRVYRPAVASSDTRLPSLYVTDGQMYLAQGGMVAVLDEEIRSGRIDPVLVVFLDSRDPDDLAENRRNQQFMCSMDFAAFFADELIPTIDREQRVSSSREDRVILGLSFGGLNSACFGVMLSNLFAGIAMQSPASSEHVDVVRGLYEKSEPLPLKMFLSVGNRSDNRAAVRRLKRVLDRKGYELTFVSVSEGHNWKNWGPLLDDVLFTFFARKDAPIQAVSQSSRPK